LDWNALAGQCAVFDKTEQTIQEDCGEQSCSFCYHCRNHMYSTGDPHLVLPGGGQADFRGTNNTLYSFVSAPGVAVNVRTNDADFHYKEGKLLVHGSFLSEVHFNFDNTWKLTFSALRMNQHNYAWNMVTSWCYLNGTYRYREPVPINFGLHGRASCGEYRAVCGYSSMNLTHPDWEFRVASQPVYNWVSGPKHRVDLKFLPKRRVMAVHGIVGQGLIGKPRSGKTDKYPTRAELGKVPGKIDEFTTTAMAEGAIDGAAKDYVVSEPYATTFKYSKFFDVNEVEDVDEAGSLEHLEFGVDDSEPGATPKRAKREL